MEGQCAFASSASAIFLYSREVRLDKGGNNVNNSWSVISAWHAVNVGQPFLFAATARGRAHIVIAGVHFVAMKLSSLRFASSNEGENSISNSRMIEARMNFASHIANR